MSRKVVIGMVSVLGSLTAIIVALQHLLVTAPASSPVPLFSQDATTSRSSYEPLYPIKIGDIAMLASVATSAAARAHGLSDTTELPADITKLFIFETSSRWGFWMKDMNYAIDMIWLDDLGKVVYVVASATPESYPGTTFVPPTVARYVLETVPGFAYAHGIATGTQVTLPTIP
jgi:uncharacterized protein